MEALMIPCTTCNRHYRVDDDACPFCAKPSGATRAMQSLGAALTTLVLAACYGGVDDGKYDTSWDSGGTGDTSESTVDTVDDTGTSDTGISDTGTNDTGTNDTATTDTGTTSTSDSGTTDTGGSTSDSGTTSTTSDTGY